MMTDIIKAGVLILKDNKILLCRKNNTTSKLLIPGGSIETGESPEECIVREVREELGKEVTISNLHFIGTYEDLASFDNSEIHKTVEIIMYHGHLAGNPIPSAEISEIVWFGSESDEDELSAIIKNKILPDLKKRNLVHW